MALMDDLKTPPSTSTGFRSKVDVWRDSLNDEDRAAFDAAVNDTAWNTSALRRVVLKHGVEISDPGFRQWRLNARRIA